jgi:hypothetical protein
VKKYRFPSYEELIKVSYFIKYIEYYNYYDICLTNFKIDVYLEDRVFLTKLLIKKPKLKKRFNILHCRYTTKCDINILVVTRISAWVHMNLGIIA